MVRRHITKIIAAMNARATKRFQVLDLGPAQPARPPIAPAAPTIAAVVTTGSTPVDIEALILSTLGIEGCIENTFDFAAARGIDHQSLIGALKSLLADNYCTDEALTQSLWSLTEEGQSLLAMGSPEFQVFQHVPSGDGISMKDLQEALGEVCKVGLGPCMKSKWVAKRGDMVVRLADSVVDETITILTKVKDNLAESVGEEELKNLKKRKLVQQNTRKSYRVSRGGAFRAVRVRRHAELTKEMLGDRADMAQGAHWSDLEFKAVNLNSMGVPVTGGNFHPLLKVRAEFRRILMEMGFVEMPTNKWVESSFWNFDALFQPQSHPARDAHDTFFMKSPAHCNSIPAEYYETVKNTHEKGGFGSIGYGCVFKREEATKNLLRTHTTAISAQMLHRLANQEGGFTPQKYFSIDRVFRNEAMDATHLCEFHQVEGLVADYDLTLGNLIGIIKTFFEKIGITQLRFKPAYNPYTEPSMEIFGFHPDLNKWTEIGNSGMFRPEMLRPMGLPANVRVIAWGLSLERPTMIKYRIENIRDLFGHKADITKQRNAPMAIF